jgi:sugar O-acyltransferase (sialic acid O-acetyltransferase NeuD family)
VQVELLLGERIKVNIGVNKKIVILGASAFAEEVADIISQIGTCELIGFVEGINRERCKERLRGLTVTWIDEVGKFQTDCHGICAVGSTKREIFIQQAVRAGLGFTSILHPTALVSKTSKLGQGTIVSPGVIIAAYTEIGEHVIINRGALIGHHASIDNYVTVSPGANIAGRTRIGDCCYIGMGSIVIDGISIGRNSVVAAGAVVTKDVPESVMVAGMPAKIMKKMEV